MSINQNIEDYIHNKNFKILKKAVKSHPEKKLQRLTNILNMLPFVVVEDAHTYSEITYEKLEAEDIKNRTEHPEWYKNQPKFPENFFVKIDNSMTFYTCGYMYFVIQKDDQGNFFKQSLDKLVKQNPACFILPRSVWREGGDNYTFDDDYAFVIEFQPKDCKRVYKCHTGYIDPDSSNIYYKKDIAESKIQEKLFFQRLTNLVNEVSY